MTLKLIAGSLYLGFVVFVLLNLLWGAGGLWDIQDLLAYQEELTANIHDLKEINADLSRELKALSSSPDTLKLYARSYGYFAPDEYVVKIQNQEENYKSYRLGSLLKKNFQASSPNPIFQLISLTVAVISFIIGQIISKRFKGKASNDYQIKSP